MHLICALLYELRSLETDIPLGFLVVLCFSNLPWLALSELSNKFEIDSVIKPSHLHPLALLNMRACAVVVCHCLCYFVLLRTETPNLKRKNL